jgi:hypothetical protein
MAAVLNCLFHAFYGAKIDLFCLLLMLILLTRLAFYKISNDCVWNYSLKQNVKSLEAHSKISAAHRLRNTDLWYFTPAL